MIKRFIAAITKRLNGKAVLSIAGSFAPPSEFITDDVIIDYPCTSVCTISFCVTYAQTNRLILIPTPISKLWMFGRPCALKRKFLDSSITKHLGLRWRIGKQTKR